MDGLAFPVDEEGNVPVLKYQFEQPIVGIFFPHENADIAEAIAVIAREAQDIRGNGLNLDAAVRRFHEHDTFRRNSGREDRRLEESPLDSRQCGPLEASTVRRCLP